jgi:hypothetical protein
MTLEPGPTSWYALLLYLDGALIFYELDEGGVRADDEELNDLDKLVR